MIFCIGPFKYQFIIHRQGSFLFFLDKKKKQKKSRTNDGLRPFVPARATSIPCFFLFIKMVYRLVNERSFFELLFNLFVCESLDYLLAFDRGVTRMGVSTFLFLQLLAFLILIIVLIF